MFGDVSGDLVNSQRGLVRVSPYILKHEIVQFRIDLDSLSNTRMKAIRIIQEDNPVLNHLVIVWPNSDQ